MIADDQQLIRESLKIILNSDPNFEVVKVVGSGCAYAKYEWRRVYSFGKKEVSKYKSHNINDF